MARTMTTITTTVQTEATEAPARPKPEPLEKVAKRLKGLMADASLGPVLVARELVQLEGRWGEYEQEETLSEWVRACLAPKTLKWFKTLADADAHLGPENAKLLQAPALVWLSGVVDASRKDAILERVRGLYQKNGRNPVTMIQAKYAWKRLNDRA